MATRSYDGMSERVTEAKNVPVSPRPPAFGDRYLIARGLTGDSMVPVTGNGGAANRNS
jgi:hypothetical protein